MDGEAERETKLEEVFFCHSFTGFSPLMVLLEMLVVVGFEEGFDLFCEEGEEFLRCFGNHQLARDGNFGLRKGECGIAIELNRAHTEVGTTQIDCQIDTLSFVVRILIEETGVRTANLLRTIRNCRHICWNLMQRLSILL